MAKRKPAVADEAKDSRPTETVRVEADIAEMLTHISIRRKIAVSKLLSPRIRSCGYRCTQCGMTHDQHAAKYGRTLHVHRLVPRSRYTVEGCVTVCVACHGTMARGSSDVPDEAAPNRDPRETFFAPPELQEALAAFIAVSETPTDKSKLCRQALGEYLEAKGYWPRRDE
jgi:hypothetical protein